MPPTEDGTFDSASIVSYEYGESPRIHIGDASDRTADSDDYETLVVFDLPSTMTHVEACEWFVNNVDAVRDFLSDHDVDDETLSYSLSHALTIVQDEYGPTDGE
jgi:hypothetical protein